MERRLPDLTEDWFAQYGTANPAVAAGQWDEWLSTRARTPAQKYKKALELATGLNESAIRHYLKGRSYKLGPKTLAILDNLSRLLGVDPPPRRQRQAPPSRPARRDVRIALVAELEAIPSPPYHLAVIRGVVEEAASHHFSVALHAMPKHDMNEAIERLLRTSRVDGLVMLRLTPAARCLRTLAAAGIPLVLIHADRFRYPSPVLTNIVPRQGSIRPKIRRWAEGLPDGRSARSNPHGGKQREIAVVTMPDEEVADEFDRTPRVEPSIRNERIRLIMGGLRGFDPIRFVVEDYSFRHAPAVVAAHPHARAYVCLSDEIAVGIKHLLAVRYPKGHNRAIVGFDDSQLAAQEQITSFGQHLDELGHLAIQALHEWFGRPGPPPDEWPEFRETPTDVYLE